LTAIPDKYAALVAAPRPLATGRDTTGIAIATCSKSPRRDEGAPYAGPETGRLNDLTQGLSASQKRDLAALRRLLRGDRRDVLRAIEQLFSTEDPAVVRVFEGDVTRGSTIEFQLAGELKRLVRAPHRSFAALEVLARSDVLASTRSLCVRELHREDLLSNAKRLESLWLISPAIDSLDGLKRCRRLRELDVCADGDLRLRGLEALRSLRELRLRGGDSIDLTSISRCESLRLLDISTTSIDGTIDLTPLRDCTALRELRISAASIVSPATLGTLKGLRTLHIAGTPVQDLGFVRDLPALRHLELDERGMYQDIEALLPRFKQLHRWFVERDTPGGTRHRFPRRRTRERPPVDLRSLR
jgi:hypothetical protein